MASSAPSPFSNGSALVAHVKQAIKNAQNKKSKLSSEVLHIEGMSSAKGRHLLNNLCNVPNVKLLEIGSWKGSTFISALYRNKKNVKVAYSIDNWSKFGGPKTEFTRNLSKFLPAYPIKAYDQDSFKFDPKTITEKINVYIYDGSHTAKDQERALTYYRSVFADLVVFICDDWRRTDVQEGTISGLVKSGYDLLYHKVLPSAKPDDYETWWNGYYVAVLKKRS